MFCDAMFVCVSKLGTYNESVLLANIMNKVLLKTIYIPIAAARTSCGHENFLYMGRDINLFINYQDSFTRR